MNKLAVQRQSRPMLPELSELFAGFPTFAGLRPLFDSHMLRLEDETKDGIYEVRAELPGIDPSSDLEITVQDGRLTIKAERTQTGQTNGFSEFSYGSFTRTVPLPDGADEDDIHAIYDRGILTISVPVSDDDEGTEKRIEVIETVLLDEEDEEDDDYDDDDEDQDGDIDEESAESEDHSQSTA